MSNQPPKSVKQHCLVVQYQFYLTIPVHCTMLIVVQEATKLGKTNRYLQGRQGGIILLFCEIFNHSQSLIIHKYYNYYKVRIL